MRNCLPRTVLSSYLHLFTIHSKNVYQFSTLWEKQRQVVPNNSICLALPMSQECVKRIMCISSCDCPASYGVGPTLFFILPVKKLGHEKVKQSD